MDLQKRGGNPFPGMFKPEQQTFRHASGVNVGERDIPCLGHNQRDLLEMGLVTRTLRHKDRRTYRPLRGTISDMSQGSSLGLGHSDEEGCDVGISQRVLGGEAAQPVSHKGFAGRVVAPTPPRTHLLIQLPSSPGSKLAKI